ncbi:MAG TPA: tRNA 2-thiouridine(34) synthase MnmA [Candidatus Latescibacteria bacterium]|nr:tRNA 2-thiouridine(34) synthase MnmA [Candidatus Latescibacterota bacterium]
MKVAVGMSGGVDSSVAALLMVRAGHEVSGILMKIWPGPDAPGAVRSACYGPDEAEDIRAAGDVCARLGIPFHVFDCSSGYEDLVLRYFREGYLEGTTPNPCVRCNPLVKFGILPEAARQAGLAFDRFATGHYARVEHDAGLGRFLLRKAVDARKDQSYFLYRLSQKQLGSTLFPLGELTKSRVRAIAQKEHLPVHDRKESQDFYGGDLQDILGRDGLEGEIVDRAGRVLGRHHGVRNYTIGQRKGLGIAHPVPLYVIAIDAKRNRLVVGPEEETYAQSCLARDCAWVMVERLAAPAEVQVKVRSGGRLVRATVSPLDEGRARAVFAEPVSSVAPGQSAVFYLEDIVLGGGIIETAE